MNSPFVRVDPGHTRKNCVFIVSFKYKTGFCHEEGDPKKNKIIDIELIKLYTRIDGLGYQLKLSKNAKDFIADKGFDKQYGARPLKRAIQKYIEDALAEEIINTKLKEGDSIKMDLNKKTNEIVIKISEKKKKTDS